VNALLSEMGGEARSVVELGAGGEQITLRRTAFMRYAGQGHEIEIDLPSHDITAEDLPALTRAFEVEYGRQFSRPVPGMVIEILNWAVYASTPARPVADAPATPAERALTRDTTAELTCDVDGATKQAHVVARADLTPGDVVQGPALITEPQTTTLVSADFTARVDSLGNLMLTRQA
jgi:N-methylhydantoinase A